jgi:hypothetical protein
MDGGISLMLATGADVTRRRACAHGTSALSLPPHLNRTVG